MKKSYIILIIILNGLFFLGCICSSSQSLSNGTDVKIVNTPTATKLTYKEIEQNYAKMTDAQWNNYENEIIGTRVNWRASVREVYEDGTVTLDMNQEFLHSIYLDGISYESALELDKGSVIEFEASIVDITTFLGLSVYLDNPIFQ
ncbi:MAG: hypothetical protein ACOCWM_02515 [Cyclobacteriaceae bacterium]